MREKTRRTRRVGWLAALLGAFVLALSVMPVTAWAAPQANSLDAVYVSADGDDVNGSGTQVSPLATLAKAVEVAIPGTEDNPTEIYVMSNLEMTAPARYRNKHISISSQGEGAPFTVTRRKFTGEAGDPARLGYNSAMIEVNGTTNQGVVSTLLLTNIIFDDDRINQGEYFIQASTCGSGTTDFGDLIDEDAIKNSDIVQDSMIAVYNGVGRITLGNGAVLKNYGGMSAVRLSSGELIMRAGSKIVDETMSDRTKGTEISGADKGLYGPAGAIWVQGGTVTMERGSTVGNMYGRAIYIDGGKATVNGTIQNIKASAEMWQGRSGTAIHVRGDGQAILGQTGVIDAITSTVHAGYTGAVMTNGDRNEGENVGEGYDFEAKAGSVIRNVSGFPALFSNYGNELLNGTVENCTNDYIIGGFGQVTYIGSDGLLQYNNATEGAAKSVVYTSNASDVYMNGTLKGNEVGTAGFYIINQSGGGAYLEIGEGAVIEGTGGNYGVYVNASESKCVMNGGVISGFSYGVNCRGKLDRDGTFIMNGGTITGNSLYGVYFNGVNNSQSICELNGGVIEGNDSAEVYVSGGCAEDAFEHVKIAPGVVAGNHIVGMTLGDVTLDGNSPAVQLGQAKSEVKDRIKELVQAKHADWSVAGSNALWLKPSENSIHFLLGRPSSAKNTTMYVAYIPVDTNGQPTSNAELKLIEVENADPVDITLENLTPNQSYAVMLVNTDIYRLVPDSVSKYIGGGRGEEGNYEETGGFPEITFANCLDEINEMKIGDEPVQGDFMQALLGLLDVTYFDTEGNPVSSDEEPGEYVVHLAWNQDPIPEVSINGNDVADELGEGTLIIRHIDDVDGAQSGDTTHELLESDPDESVTHAEAMARKGGGSGTTDPEFYTNNDEGRQADDAGIQLLDDDLLVYEDEDRTTPMENKGDSHLGPAGDGKEWSYEFHYLDLVDAHNGNAWVSASYGTTVWLPYPEGVTKDNAEELGVKVIHYNDLHREYGITGQGDVEAAIEACEMETMNIHFTDVGIKFDVGRSGFSPFAVAWKTDAPDEPETPVTPPSTKYYEITASAGEGGSISPSGTHSYVAGSDVSFSITPDEGYTVGSVTVDGVDVGQRSSYTFADLDDDHTISVTFMPGSAPADPDDTGVSDWLETDEHVAYLHGYGDGSGKFGPENPMTRAEVAQMFYNLLLDRSRGDRQVAFEDVPEGAYYEEAVITLASRGILNGTGPTTYEPDRPITRAEFVAIAMRFSNGEFEGENTFVDVPDDAWYRDYVVGATSFGWIYGYQDGSHRFGPDDTITRGQATMVTNRMLGRVADGAWIVGHLGDVRTFSDLPQGHYAFFDVVEATNAHDYERDGRYEDWTGLAE